MSRGSVAVESCVLMQSLFVRGTIQNLKVHLKCAKQMIGLSNSGCRGKNESAQLVLGDKTMTIYMEKTCSLDIEV